MLEEFQKETKIPKINRKYIARSKEYYINKALQKEKIENKETTKKTIAIQSGYTPSTAESNVLEKTIMYTEISEDFIRRTGFSLDKFLDEIKSRVENGELKTMKLEALLTGSQKLMTLYKGFLPSYKKKETTKQEDGSYKSVWTSIN